MATKQYIKGLQKLFTRVYGAKLPNDTDLPGGTTAGNALPTEMYVDLLEDDLCFALVDTTAPPVGETEYSANVHEHEFLSDVLGTYDTLEWAAGTYSPIIKHSPLLSGKKIIWQTTTPAPEGAPLDYKEVMFDCDDVTFAEVAAEAPQTESIILYKRVLIDGAPADSDDPADIDPSKSPLIAFFDGSTVVLVPNGNQVQVVISAKGLMRWGIGV